MSDVSEAGSKRSAPALTENHFDKWLQAFGAAWQAQSTSQLVNLFSRDASFYETPFDDGAHGRDAIGRHWQDGFDKQSEIRFMYQILALKGLNGVARWSAELTLDEIGVAVTLDGIMDCEFVMDGRCSVARMWWHRQENS